MTPWKKRNVLSAAVLALVLTAPVVVEAKLFHNAYLSFELPDLWNCNLEGTEWVCSSQNKNDAKESIIIITSKEVGPQDSFPIYENYLKTPKAVVTSTGKAMNSQVKNARRRKINDQDWVDSLHLGSEIPGYYTRYLATVKEKLAILVTLSAHQKYYTKYSNDFFKAVESLRVTVSKDLFNPKVLAPVRPGSEKIGQNVGSALPDVDGADSGSGEGFFGGMNTATLSGVFLIAAALIYYLLTKKKKRK